MVLDSPVQPGSSNNIQMHLLRQMDINPCLFPVRCLLTTLQHYVRVFSDEFMTSSSRILGCERAECQPSCCIVSLIFSGSVSVSTATWGLALRQRPTVLHIRGSYITLSLCYTVSVMTALPPEIQLWPYVLFCSWMLSRLRYITLGTEWSM